MKRFSFFILAALAAAVTGFAAEPSITSLTATPRYPWNGLVDVDVVFSEDVSPAYALAFTARDVAGGTNLPMAAVNGPFFPQPRTHRYVWNAAADLGEGFACDQVTISADHFNPIWHFDSIPEVNPNDEWAPETVYNDIQTVVSLGEIENPGPTIRCLNDAWNLEEKLGRNVVFSGASMGLRNDETSSITLYAWSGSTNRYRFVTLDYNTGAKKWDVPTTYGNPGSDVRFFSRKGKPDQIYANVFRGGYDAYWKSADADASYVHLLNRYDEIHHGSAVCGYFPHGIPFSTANGTTYPSTYGGSHAAVFFSGIPGTDRKQVIVGNDDNESAKNITNSLYSCMQNPVGRYVVPLLDGDSYFTVGYEMAYSVSRSAPECYRFMTGTFSGEPWVRPTADPYNRGRAWSKAVAMPDGVRIFLGGTGKSSGNGRVRMWNGATYETRSSFDDYPKGHPFEAWNQRDITCLLPNGKFCGVDEKLGLVVVNPLTGETYVASDDPVFKVGKMGCQLLPNGKVLIIPYSWQGRDFEGGTKICGKLYEVDFGFTRSFSTSSLCSPYLRVAEGDPEPSGIKVGLNPNGGVLTNCFAQYYPQENPTYGTLPVSTREGYAYRGWATNSTGTVFVSATDPVPETGIVLYAGWKANTYSVKFNANGGTGTMANESFTYGTSKALTANAFTRSGYTFQGWATSASGAKAYSDKQSVNNLTSTAGGTVNLYAVWKSALYMVVDLSSGSSSSKYPVSYLDAVPSGGWTDTYKSTKLVLRRCEAGTYKMQGTKSVTLTKAFYIGVFEVTQKQWTLVMGSNPATYKGDLRPVENVMYTIIRGSSNGLNWPTSSAVDSTSFMGKLRSRAGLSFDLPTDAQWEYACRAGTTSNYNDGGNAESNLRQLGRYSGNQSDGKGGYSSRHTKVGSYKANKWGIYDMHGNVFEWCLDRYSSSVSGGTDPKGPTSGSDRVKRGGNWWESASSCTSSYRGLNGPSSDSDDYDRLGLRVCLTL